VNLTQLMTQRSLELAQRLAQPHAEGAMNSLITITRYGSGWDTARGEYGTGVPTVIYDGDTPGVGAAAGVTPTQGPIQTSFGDEPEFYDSVTIFIPKSVSTLPMINDVVLVVDTPDTQFVNRQFRITSVGVGGRLVPSITMNATGAAPSRTTV